MADKTVSPAPDAPAPKDFDAIVEGVWKEFYPESTPAGHPVPYLSGAWHHARAVMDELKTRLKGAA
jgi:hypothetical protein